jgi:FKBP-type peptidyl-prolyl cis-trans isomerase (trigger factor)
MGKTKKYFLVLGIFLTVAITSVFWHYESMKEEEVIKDAVMSVNGVLITERDIDHYLREVSRDYFESDLTPEEIEEEAKRTAVALVVIEEYFDKKNIYISEDEIEKEIMNYVEQQPGAETKEDYFNIMEMRGYSRQEVIRNIELSLKNQKLEDLLAKDIVVDDKDIQERYEWYQQYYENDEDMEILPLEEVKELIRQEIAIEKAVDIITEELNQEGERAEIVFFE